MKAIVFLESRNNSQNCIQTFTDVQSVKVCASAKDCHFGGPEYKKGCGGIIIDGDHLDYPVKVEVIP